MRMPSALEVPLFLADSPPSLAQLVGSAVELAFSQERVQRQPNRSGDLSFFEVTLRALGGR